MRQRFRIQISDLEPIQSGVEQELTIEETEKIVGGAKAPEEVKKIVGGAKALKEPEVWPWQSHWPWAA